MMFAKKKLSKFNYSFIITLFSVLLFFAACTPIPSEVKKTISDGEIQKIQKNQSSTDESGKKHSPLLETLVHKTKPLVLKESSKATENIDTETLVTQVINTTKKIVLNPKYVYDLSYREFTDAEGTTYLLPKIIEIFSHSVYLTYQANPKRILNSGILEKYYDILKLDCGKNLKGPCSLIKYIKDRESLYTTELLKILFANTEDFQKKRKIIRIAFEITTDPNNKDLLFMMIATLGEHLKRITKENVTPKELSQDANFLANIMLFNDFSENLDFDLGTDLLETLKDIAPWEMSRKRQDVFTNAMTSIIALSSKKLLYDDKGHLSEYFKNSLDKIEYTLGNQHEQGTGFIINNLQGNWHKLINENDKKAYPTGLSKLNFNTIKQNIKSDSDMEVYHPNSSSIMKTLVNSENIQFKNDEYDFLAHQIFHEKYKKEDALAFWNNTTRDETRTLEALNNIFKINIINAIVFTNSKMINFYNANTNLDIIDLLDESKTAASKVSDLWSKIIRVSEDIGSFASRVIGISNGLHGQKLEELLADIQELENNIKFLVTYPNMYPLIHVMVENNLEGSFPNPWSGEPVTIVNEEIVYSFFSGNFEPWFNFGHNGLSLDSDDLPFTFYYALLTSIFDTFKIGKDINFTPTDFLTKVGGELIKVSQERLQTELDGLAKFKNNQERVLSEIENQCAEERSAENFEADLFANMPQVNEDGTIDFDAVIEWGDKIADNMATRTSTNSIPLLQITKNIYDPTTNIEGKMGHFLGQFNIQQQSSFIRSIKNDFEIATFLPDVLLEIYKLFQNKFEQENLQGTDTNIDEEFFKQFTAFNSMKADYLKIYTEIKNRIDNCEWTFIKREEDIRAALFFKELAFLNQLFEKLWAMKDDLKIARQENLIIDTAQPLCGPGSPDLQNCDSIDNGMIFQQILDLRTDLFKFSQDATYPDDYRNGFSNIRIGHNKISFSKTDAITRIEYYLKTYFKGQYVLSRPSNITDNSIFSNDGNSDTKSIPLNFDKYKSEEKKKAKEEFIKSGASVFAEFVTWAIPESNTSILGEKGDILINLFKLGAIPKNFDSEDNKKNIQAVDFCKSYVENSATEEEKQEFSRQCLKTSAKEIIDYQNRILRLTNINPRDQLILNLIGLTEKNTQDTYSKNIKDFGRKLFYQYDLIFKRIFGDSSFVTEDASSWFLKHMSNYVESAKDRRESKFIFGFPEEIENIFLDVYSRWMDRYFDTNAEFIQAMKEMIEAENPEFLVGEFRYHTEIPFSIGTETEGPLAPLISPSMYLKFFSHLKSIDTDTEGFFGTYLNQQTQRMRGLMQISTPQSGDETEILEDSLNLEE